WPSTHASRATRMNHTNPPPTRPFPLRVVATLGLATALFAGLVLLSGCPKQSKSPTGGDAKQEVTTGTPWEAFGQRLRKGNDLTACKTAVGQLNAELTTRKEFQPPPPSPEADQALTSAAPLSPDDLAEARNGSFTALDAVYLADCFYLRDAARTLDAPGLPTVRRAELAFAWVCRQVYLNPWVIDVG